MATQTDEELLRQQWNPETLGRYEGQWIAFRDGVISSHQELAVLSERYLGDIREKRGPLFAFVSFRLRA